MSSDGGPERLGAVLRDFLESTGLAARLQYLELYAAWEEIVGPELRAHTRVVGVVRHKVHVEVDSAAHLHELRTFHARTLLDELRKRVPTLHLAGLVFKPGGTRVRSENG